MKLTEAKKICNQIDIIRSTDGTLRCRYLIPDGGMCRLPTKFRCDVVSHVERNESKVEVSKSAELLFGTEPWSVSKFMYLLKCPLSYRYKYIDKVEGEKKAYLWLGSQFHNAMARIGVGLEWDLEEVPEYVPLEDALKLKAFLEVASRRSWPAGNHEVYFGLELEDGLVLQGFIDFESKDGKTIVERKYAQNANDYHLLTLYYQLAVYLMAKPRVEEVTIEVARKSRLRPGKNEAMDAFYERVLADTLEHESELFVRRTYLRREFDLERVKKELSLLARVAVQYWRMDTWPMAAFPQTCSWCEYYRHCRRRFGMGDEEDENNVGG